MIVFVFNDQTFSDIKKSNSYAEFANAALIMMMLGIAEVPGNQLLSQTLKFLAAQEVDQEFLWQTSKSQSEKVLVLSLLFYMDSLFYQKFSTAVQLALIT